MTSTPSSSPSSGIDIKTLWITAAASAAAAFVTSQFWAAGTLAAAAVTPVLVALLREGLAKSTDVVVKAVPPVKGVVRSARPEGPRTQDWSAADLTAEPLVADADDPAARVPQAGEITYHGSSPRARHWRVAIVTGLLGFLIAAVVFTVPELLAGESASGGGRHTTLFGGKQRESATPAETTTTKPVPVKTVTTAPQETVTVPPQTVTTPPPAQTTTPAPQQQTTTTVPTTTPPPVAEPPPAEIPPG
jgi:hypothetical protein